MKITPVTLKLDTCVLPAWKYEEKRDSQHERNRADYWMERDPYINALRYLKHTGIIQSWMLWFNHGTFLVEKPGAKEYFNPVRISGSPVIYPMLWGNWYEVSGETDMMEEYITRELRYGALDA